MCAGVQAVEGGAVPAALLEAGPPGPALQVRGTLPRALLSGLVDVAGCDMLC